MTMFRITAAALALVCAAGVSSAATLSGVFDVKVVNVTNLYSSESQATLANLNQALAGTLGGATAGNDASQFAMDDFVWTGDLHFRVGGAQTAAYTIGQWLTEKPTGAATSGVATGLDATVAGKQLSFPNINDGTATSTFFMFTRRGDLTAGTFTVNHDDGMRIFDDGVSVGGVNGPTAVRTTTVSGFDGGKFSLLYVATNGNPSILEVDTTTTPVPLPAGLPLLLAGMGGFAVVARRKRAAS